MKDHQSGKSYRRLPSSAEEPLKGAHPVRIALVLEIIEVLREHGYRRQAGGRSLADFLRKLNALTVSYEGVKH